MNFWKKFRRKLDRPETECLQCGLLPGKQYMVTTDEALMHPHECSWCKSTVYFPGPMFECAICNPAGIQRPGPAA